MSEEKKGLIETVERMKKVLEAAKSVKKETAEGKQAIGESEKD